MRPTSTAFAHRFFTRSPWPPRTLTTAITTRPPSAFFPMTCLLAAAIWSPPVWEYCLEYLREFHYTAEEVDYLRSLNRFKPEFLDYLANIRFTGDVWAAPEGSVFFWRRTRVGGHRPADRSAVGGDLPHQHPEPAFHPGQQGRPAVIRPPRAAPAWIFSLRRTMGPGRRFRRGPLFGHHRFHRHQQTSPRPWPWTIPPVGTNGPCLCGGPSATRKSRSAILPRPSPTTPCFWSTPMTAKRASTGPCMWPRSLPSRGYSMIGVRLDSGDLVEMSRRARVILDDAGLPEAQVVVLRQPG